METEIDQILGKLGHQRGPIPDCGRSHGRPWNGICEDTPALFVGWIVAAYRRLGRPVPGALRIDGRPVRIVARPLTFGDRHFFECPICGRRRDALYFVGQYVGCRKCLRLGYRSQASRPGSVYGFLDDVYNRDRRLWRRYRVDESLMAGFVQDLRKRIGQELVDMITRVEVQNGQDNAAD